MKKICALLLALLLCVAAAACEKKDTAPLRVYTLNGTTGFGMAPLIATADDENYRFTVETNAVNVRDAMINGDADIAALPTNVAAALYNATNGGVTVLALNTGGVLYLVSTGAKIESLSDLAGKTVYTPAQNPAFITAALLEKADITDAVLDSTTYAAPEALRDAVASGLVELAILPEPMVTIAKSAAAKAGHSLTVALDLTAAWNEHLPEGSLVQGCVVVRTAFLKEHPTRVAEFLTDYKLSIDYVNKNPEKAAEQIVAAGIFANAAVAAAALPRCNILFVSGEEMKTALSSFLAEMPLASIGGKLPDDGFYYIPNATD